MLSIVTDANNLLMRRNLGTATNAVNIALQRMSTGYKINSAKDDTAGMYVATRLNTQIRGLKQAQKNVQDGMSILQTAEGAYSNITDILLRLRELSLQASNGIYDKASRDAMQLEADELTAELRRIQESTSFNGLSLFNNPPSESAAAMPALASTLNILDMSTSGDGVVEQSNNSRSTFSLLRSSAPMMMSASPASTGGNDGVALMSVDDEGVATASTITSTAYDFTASQTQTITVGEGEHQRIYTVKNKQTTTSSLTINFDTGTGQITFLGQNFEIKATEMDKTHNLIINGGSNTVYTGDMADRVETVGGQSSVIYGRGGDDLLIGNSSHDNLYGEAGEDVIYVNKNTSRANGGADNDTIYVNSHYTTINGGDGDDTFYTDVKCSSGSSTKIYGNAGDDKFYTTANTQYVSFVGGSGYNQVEDLGINNTKVNLYDFSGNDVSTLYAVEFTGKNHTQTITIDGKNYEVTCGSNNYKTFYYSVKDGVITFDSLSLYFTIKAETNKQHNVLLDGGFTTFYGGNLNDIIQVKKGNCVVYGGDGDEKITYTGDGLTKIYGEDGADEIILNVLPYNQSIIDGGNDNDTINVNSANKCMANIWGGAGDDTFNVKTSQVVLNGEGGNDTYNFKTGTANNVVIDNNENGDTNVINTNGTDVLTSGFDGSKGVAITFAIGETKEITLDNGITYQITNNLDRENQFMYYYDPITFETSFASSYFTIDGEEDKKHVLNIYGDNNTINTGNEADNIKLLGQFNSLYTYGGNDNISHEGRLKNIINAGIGDDTITLKTRCDGVVSGEEGNDKFIINGSAGNVTGGAGDDEYVLNYQGAKVTDADGNNVFEVNANNCTVTGGTGNDTFTVNGTGNNITCGGGNDYVLLNAAGNTVTGGTGDNYFVNTDPDLENDMTNIVKNPNSDALGFTTAGEVKTFTVGDKTYTVTNTGADGTSNATNSVSYNYNQNTGELTLTGSNFSVVTEDANQNLVIKGSNNNITTGSGNDNVVVSSGEGNIINTNAGADKITSNTANNAISSGEGNDSITLNASSGSKLVDAGSGDNTITINSNENTNIVAGDGKNNLNVSGSTNTITLGNGANTAVMSGTGNTITAGNGNNKLSSVNGGNNIVVGSGNNTLGLQGDNNTATTLGGTNTFNVNGNSNTIDTEGNGNYNITGSNNIVDTQRSGTFKVSGDENTITSAFGSGIYTINGDGNGLSVQQGNQDVSITGNSNVYTSLSGSSDIKAKGDLNTITTTDGTNTFDVKGSDNEIVGGSGADEIEVSGSNNTISGNDGDDYLMIGGGSNNQLDGGSGENIMINGGANTTYQNVVDMTPTPLHVRLQVGANAGDSIDFDLSFNLFNFEVDFSDIESSLDSLEDIDEMLNRVGLERANVGAIMNRLESVLQSQTTSIENYTAAKSTIMDADIAKESAELVKNQILQQTTAALMAQAKRNRADIIMRLLR